MICPKHAQEKFLGLGCSRSINATTSIIAATTARRCPVSGLIPRRCKSGIEMSRIDTKVPGRLPHVLGQSPVPRDYGAGLPHAPVEAHAMIKVAEVVIVVERAQADGAARRRLQVHVLADKLQYRHLGLDPFGKRASLRRC
jgi:hypothetical protein